MNLNNDFSTHGHYYGISTREENPQTPPLTSNMTKDGILCLHSVAQGQIRFRTSGF